MTSAVQIARFVAELERIKTNTRTAWASTGRTESIAEHSWRLSLFALALGPRLAQVDISRVVAMCLVHDLGETYDGDTSARIPVDPAQKTAEERAGVQRVCDILDDPERTMIRELWEEYVAGLTSEARVAKALDKMETIIQHNQGAGGEEFDHEFNLGYGRGLADQVPELRELRDVVDAMTREAIAARDRQAGSISTE